MSIDGKLSGNMIINQFICQISLVSPDKAYQHIVQKVRVTYIGGHKISIKAIKKTTLVYSIIICGYDEYFNICTNPTVTF